DYDRLKLVLVLGLARRRFHPDRLAIVGPGADLDEGAITARIVLAGYLLEHPVLDPDFECALDLGDVGLAIQIEAKRRSNRLADPIIRPDVLAPRTVFAHRRLRGAQISDGELLHRVGPGPQGHDADTVGRAIPHGVVEIDGDDLAPLAVLG